MKICRGTKKKPCILGEIEQPLSEFHKSSAYKSGYSNKCRTCENLRVSENHKKNPDALRKRSLKWKIANRDKTRDYDKKRYWADRDFHIQRKLLWQKSNPEKAAANTAEYRARKVKATPTWLSEEHKEQILRVYEHARECEILTGDKYHVDHIVPLKNENVSGLHVPWNLQVLPADINIAKSNSHG